MTTTATRRTDRPSFYHQLFPPNRNREKEYEASKRFKPQVPPYLNSIPKGYKPGWVTSSIFLCPAVSEYAIADIIVPYFYRCNLLDTPNKVTLFNVFVIRPACIYCIFPNSDGEESRIENTNNLMWYWMLVVLLYFQMVLDAADGQLAQRYGLGSEFGAWLDGTTDNLFGVCFAVVSLYNTATNNNNGSNLFPTIILSMFFATSAMCGHFFIDAKIQGLHWNQMNTFHRLGVYQVLFFSYINFAIIFIYVYLGWLI